jgi:hypothetical protein
MSLSLSGFPVAMQEHAKRNERMSGNGLPGSVCWWLDRQRSRVQL